ncbi:VWA domain-containing protein [Rhodohalobacter sp. SW132]|uniref:vWA domain-containing protein n=1 Tax=Rhodohalobacter sp. SW132 TaxID=2293433 RepID=UPI000E21FED3|nr:VWA domain-containing protein [Rhodohalobacter sp. SW132]REL37704.1 VWA domain-containing protein [Rhodohalobacter sp. SW132]
MSWANPEYFWLLILIPFYLGYVIWKHFFKKRASITFSSTAIFDNIPGNYKAKLIWLTPLLYSAAFTLLVTAAARPQLQNTTVEESVEGIDIMLSIDISSSMLAEDLQPNRLIAAKEIAADFIDVRRNDRIGIGVFARESFTVVPPTVDHNLAKQMLETVDLGMVRDGTAIGVGIATAINRLRDSSAESRVIILLTDGMNNAGEIDPITAGELAATFGIRVYTLGVGSRGTAPYPIDDPVFGRRYQNVEVNIDEEMLQQIATQTGGQYFRATTTEELSEIYDVIDQLETSEIEEILYRDYEDRYSLWLLPGIILLITGFLNERWVTGSPLFEL